MVHTIEALLNVQDKDLRIFNLQKQIDSIPAESNELKNVLQAAEEGLERAKQDHLEVEKRIKELEIEIDTQKGKIRALQAKTPEIRKNDEYRAMLNEIDALEKKISEIEDNQLIFMDKLDATKLSRQQQEKAVEASRKRVDEAIADMVVRDKNCRQQIEAITGEKSEIASKIPSEIYRSYTRLIGRSSRSDTFIKGLVSIQNENCTSCFLCVTPQVKTKVHKGEIVPCENCGALLYYGE